MKMSHTRLRAILNHLDLSQAEFGRLHGLGDRAVRRYLQAPDNPSAREIPPGTALLTELLGERPELLPVIRSIATRGPLEDDTGLRKIAREEAA